MSKTLSSAAQQQFDSEVKHAFQGGGAMMLRQTVTVRTGVVADIYKFRKMGKGQAQQKTAPQTDVTPMNVSHSLINCTLSNWTAAEYTDIFDAAEVNFDEQTELAETIAKAIDRRCDQLIIDSMDASGSYAGTVGTDVGGTGTDWNTAKARRAKKHLDDNEVDKNDRHILVSADGLEAMLGTTEATSSDYNTVKALVNGEINTWLGFTWHTIGTRDEGGLPLSGSTRTSFAWHRSAIGLAVGIDVRTEVNYIAEKTSWLCNGLFKAGAVVRDSDGVVKITTTEA